MPGQATVADGCTSSVAVHVSGYSAPLQWFVSEQVEEEASADAIVQKAKLMADAPGGIFFLDQELAQRAPAPAAEGE